MRLLVRFAFFAAPALAMLRPSWPPPKRWAAPWRHSGRALIIGGSKTGRRAVANAALAAGGRVTGVIPCAVSCTKRSPTRPTHLRVVAGMHDRKAAMVGTLADAFVALLGGLGTLEEFFEVGNLGPARLATTKPIALLRVPGFFDPLLQFLDALVAHRFVRREHRYLLIVDDDPAHLLARLDWEYPLGSN